MTAVSIGPPAIGRGVARLMLRLTRRGQGTRQAPPAWWYPPPVPGGWGGGGFAIGWQQGPPPPAATRQPAPGDFRPWMTTTSCPARRKAR